MTIHLTHIGGGRIGQRDFSKEPWGKFFPQGVPSCCDSGLPDAAVFYDPKYVSEFAPGRMTALGCYLADNKPVAGDKFLQSVIHAGADLHTIVARNDNGCAGLTYHFELHDLYALLQEKAGGAASVAEVTFPTVTATDPSDQHLDVRAEFGAPYFGAVNGTVTVDTETVCCAKHKALVLVLDTLPNADAAPTSLCAKGCNYGGPECGTGVGVNCIDIKVSAHVHIPHGIRYL